MPLILVWTFMVCSRVASLYLYLYLYEMVSKILTGAAIYEYTPDVVARSNGRW
jgi:hypothetical protein